MQPFKSKFFPTNGFGYLSVPWSPTLDFLHVLVASSQVCHLCLIKKKKKNWNYHKIKSSFYDKTRKNVKKNFLCPLASSLPCAEHCVSTLCIDQTSPISRNTCSAVIKSTILASARQLLKDNIPWEPVRAHTTCHFVLADLDCVNCQGCLKKNAHDLQGVEQFSDLSEKLFPG